MILPTRPLGLSGLELTTVGFGAWAIGGGAWAYGWGPQDDTDLLAARRGRALGVRLLSGGYGQDELERAGAYRVYQDPGDLLRHLDEVGVRS